MSGKEEGLIAEDLLRTKPSNAAFIQQPATTVAWCGRARAVMGERGPASALEFNQAISDLWARSSRQQQDAALVTVPLLLHAASQKLRLATVGPRSLAVDAGAVFDYFDELRKLIETATGDLLFVDPYLDADFVSRYLPFVKLGVRVRLLGRHNIAQLAPAVSAFRSQHQTAIEVRSSSDLHDRWLIMDGAAAYQSGASFKDGAKRTVTTLTQIVDAFQVVKSQYETLWSQGQQHL